MHMPDALKTAALKQNRQNCIIPHTDRGDASFAIQSAANQQLILKLVPIASQETQAARVVNGHGKIFLKKMLA